MIAIEGVSATRDQLSPSILRNSRCVKSKPHRTLLIAAAFAALVQMAGPSSAESQAPLFETKAPNAILVDAESGNVLFSEQPDLLIAPAALAKLMTMEVVFHALKTGEITLDQQFPVSEHAWRKGGAPSRGSTMFAALKSSISVSDLIQGIIVQSANDGCIIIAEGMSGSEEAFAERMTKRAREIGLTQSIFKNSTGLPEEGQVVTLRELVRLARHIWHEYPEYYHYYSQPDFTWNKIFQRNRNPLLKLDIGADGLGTGYTQESGYAIVGSAARNQMRLFTAMSGMTSEKERSEEASRLLNWGSTEFVRERIFNAGDLVGSAEIYGGVVSAVPLRTESDISTFMPRKDRDLVRARIVYDGPLSAPIKQGTELASLEIWIGPTLSSSQKLVAAENIEIGSLPSRTFDAVKELAIGWLR